ncbi:MAG: CPBP family intramembrane metalloprotease [Ardenticatenia bacterium]|nr:CPBP family intramembrane metalloprotease [Ardenticatenia bacterium]
MIELLYALVVLVMANVGERYRPVWYVAKVLLSITNLLLMVVGGLALIAPMLFSGGEVIPPLFFSPGVGVVLLTTGSVAFLVLWVPTVRRALAEVLPFNPERPVHTLAVVYAVYFVGVTVAQYVADISTQLFMVGAQVTLAVLWVQGGFFVALSLAGVGFPIRRSFGESLRRLGLMKLNGRHVTLVLGTVVGLELFDYLVNLVWFTVDPASFERISALNERLFAQLITPAGALSLGITAGVGEEMLFRGAVQPRFGLWVTSAIFALAHTQYALSPALLEVFVIGLILGMIRERINTTAAISVHALYNIVNVLLWPLWPGS